MYWISMALTLFWAFWIFFELLNARSKKEMINIIRPWQRQTKQQEPVEFWIYVSTAIVMELLLTGILICEIWEWIAK